MAFILKSTKFIRGLVGFTRQRGLIGTREKNIFLQRYSVFEVNEFHLRTTASLAAKEAKEKDFQDFEKSFFQLNHDMQTRNVFIEQIKEVFEAIKQKGEITYPQIILLLKCCSEVTFMSTSRERIQLAEEIWKTATDLGTQFHISHYNALLNVFLENNHEFSPSEFLTVIQKEGLEPNLVTYRRILKAYCQQGDINSANGVLEKMKILNHPLNEDDFNSLILGHCEVGDLEKATDILKVMQERDIDPTSRSYALLLCGYAKHGQIEKLKELLEELPKKDVFLPDSLLLEVVYTLAVSNQIEHIDMILGRVSRNYEIHKTASRIIQRLLHKKLDSVAMKVFETIEGTDESINHTLTRSKHILNHFVIYRTPDETLDMCNRMEEKGWSKSGLSYILRQSFVKKDEHFCVNLINAMKSRNLEIRSHYFWPAIIKASEKGNSEMFNVLRSMPRKMMAGCFRTTAKIIFPNYRFGEDWHKDFETLKSLGLRKDFLARSFLEKMLTEKKFDEAEYLACSFLISRPGIGLTFLTRLLRNHPDEEKRLINILYYLAHDYHLASANPTEDFGEEIAEETNEKGTEESATDYKTNICLFDFAVPIFKEHLKDDQLLRILEYMYEKKMGIASATAASIAASIKSQNIVDAVNKLAKPEVEFQLDEDILNRKRDSEDNSSTLDAKADEKVLIKEIEAATSFTDCINILRQLVRQRKCNEAVKLVEHLSQSEASTLHSATKSAYQPFIFDLCKRGETNLAEKAFNLGVQMGLLEAEDFISVIRELFIRGKSSEAVDKYCDYMEKTKKVTAGMEFLVRTVAGKDEVAIKKLTTKMCDHIPEQLCVSHLALALTADGEVKKAKKLLDAKKLKLSEKRFYVNLEMSYNRSTSEVLENYLLLVKDYENFDRVPLYKLMVKKYAEKNDVESAKKLWLLLEEDDISNYDFLEQMREFMNDSTPQRLKSLADTFLTVGHSDTIRSDAFKKFKESVKTRHSQWS